ncbi:MAG: hypothetical protein FWC71_07270 [Defluviitaleaceae bacterium]|nr:hypothetical protein [Defluviitaleaceae bacterium]
MFGSNSKVNIFVWIGFILDLVGFLIALFLNFNLGLTLVLLALVFSVIGLVICIRRNSGIGTAILYIVLDIAFLIYLLWFF